MSKTETMRQSAHAANVKHVENMTQQIETLRQAKLQSAEELAAMLEPLAQAMAALTDETRETLAQLRQQSTQQVSALQAQSREVVQTWARHPQLMDEAARNLMQATTSLTQTSRELVRQNTWHLGWKHYALTVATGLLAALLTLGLWTWLSPKPVTHTLPSKTSVTAPHKPSSANSKHSG
jgi:tRNA U34 5-carboxymethylaminomethyl modifying GTPase MnmE/TrmE